MQCFRVYVLVGLIAIPYSRASAQANGLPSGSIVRLSPVTENELWPDSIPMIRGRLSAISTDSVTIDVGVMPVRVSRAGHRVEVLSFQSRARTFRNNLPFAVLTAGVVAALANSASRGAPSDTRTVTTVNGAVAGFIVSSVLAIWKPKPIWDEVSAH